jgi:hypothetical protein
MTSRAPRLDEILAAARLLPRKAQAALVETLLRDAAAGEGAAPEPSGLLPLPGMSETELVALSRAVLAPGRQRRMKTLLQRNAAAAISDRDQQELDALLEEADRIAVLKARAMYTLRGDPGPQPRRVSVVS